MTASHFIFWPYDEVTIDLSQDKNTVFVKTPWIQANAEIKKSDLKNLEILADKFSRQSLSPEDLGLINWFFQDFGKYPFCYILPKAKIAGSLDNHDVFDRDFIDINFEDLLLKSLTEKYGTDSKITPDLVMHMTAGLARNRWTWDFESAAAFSKVEDKICPESLFSVVRRYHLLDVLEINTGKENFDFIDKLKGDDFNLAASILVRQNHYVTEQCQSALLPALGNAGLAHSQVQEFIKEENGHDLILGAALKSFTQDPASIPTAIQTRFLMHLLRFAARRNFLGFAMAVDAFERSSYEKIDPIAKLLIKGGFEKAAKQINRHMEINDAGKHENVAIGFLQFMANCSHDYALEAFKIAEAISIVMNSISSAAVDLYRDNKC